MDVGPKPSSLNPNSQTLDPESQPLNALVSSPQTIQPSHSLNPKPHTPYPKPDGACMIIKRGGLSVLRVAGGAEAEFLLSMMGKDSVDYDGDAGEMGHIIEYSQQLLCWAQSADPGGAIMSQVIDHLGIWFFCGREGGKNSLPVSVTAV